MSDALIREFEYKRPDYEKLGAMLSALFQRIGDDLAIKTLSIESRAKTIVSFSEKLVRPGKEGKYVSLIDMTDLCGVRIVLYTLSDCKKFIRSIRDNFEIDEINSVDKTTDIDDDRFGYASTHLVVSLKAERGHLFEYKRLIGLKAEIQIRTVLQHEWAVLDWEIRYKSEVEVPRGLRRKLFRISAALEEADENFSDLTDPIEEMRSRYTQKMKEGDLKAKIDRESLEIFMTTNRTFLDILESADERGIRIGPLSLRNSHAWKYLLGLLEDAGLSTIDEIEIALSKVKDDDYNILIDLQESPNIESLGQFVILRDMVLQQLPLTQRKNAFRRIPADSPVRVIESALLLKDKGEKPADEK